MQRIIIVASNGWGNNQMVEKSQPWSASYFTMSRQVLQVLDNKMPNNL